jgi:hypothetical protein
MFFRSQRAVVLAIILIGVGGIQLLMGWSYIDDSKREASTIGTLIRVHHGKGSTYEYVFEVNGVRIRDDSGTCRTPLTSAGCAVGATVVVFYDRENLSRTLLEEFGAAGRGKVIFGAWMAGIGLLLIGLYFLLQKALAGPDESEDTEDDELRNEPEIVHIVPDR